MSPDRLKTACSTIAAALVLSIGLATAQTGEPIKFGLVVPLTGPVSMFGVPERNTLDMLADEVNKGGGLLGRKIEIVAYDDQGDPNKSSTFITRVIESDKVDVILGPTTTGTAMAVIPLAQEAEIPMISLAAGVSIVEPVKKWVFKMPHSDRQVCQVIVADMVKRGFKGLALISDTGGFGQSVRKECMAEAGKQGMKVVADEAYGPQDPDMTPQLTKIKNTQGVDAVLNCGFASGPAIVVRNYRSLGMTQPIYETHGVASKEFIKLAGPAADGVRVIAAGNVIVDIMPKDHPQYPVLKKYKDAYEARFNTPISAFGSNACDGFWIAVNAIKAAGTTDKAKVRDAIEKTSNFIGANGVFNMSPTDHNGVATSSLFVIDVKDGDWALPKQ